MDVTLRHFTIKNIKKKKRQLLHSIVVAVVLRLRLTTKTTKTMTMTTASKYS